jgi:hypothetical protein
LTGHIWPRTQVVGEVEQDGQYVPAGQTEIVLVSLQKDPDGQGMFAVDPAGQYPPVLHGKEVSVPPGQYCPEGQMTGEFVPPAHV